MTINERMFEIMKEKNIKMVELATTLSISKSVISTWKSRNTNPPSEYIERICELLEISIAYLITGHEENYMDLTENEKEMLENFKFLPDREQIKAIGYIEEKAAAYKDKSERLSNSRTG